MNNRGKIVVFTTFIVSATLLFTILLTNLGDTINAYIIIREWHLNESSVMSSEFLIIMRNTLIRTIIAFSLFVVTLVVNIISFILLYKSLPWNKTNVSTRKNKTRIVIYVLLAIAMTGISIYLTVYFSMMLSNLTQNYDGNREAINFIRNITRNIAGIVLTLTFIVSALIPIVLKFISIFRHKPAVDNESVKELS